MSERIGGHRGLDVIRVGDHRSSPTVIQKTALHELGNQGDLIGVDLYGLNETAIHNEAMMLDYMMGSGFTPKLIDIDEGVLTEQDIGVNEAPTDPELWRRNLVSMLATIRSRGLRHGDLIGNNIVTVNNWPWAVDWQEGHQIGDVPPQRNPFTDSHLVMQHIEGTKDINGQSDIPRVAKRWRAVLGSLGAVTNCGLPLKGKTFLDLGCFQGDFVALAAAEGMTAFGVDVGGFRSGENSIKIGRHLWNEFPFGAIQLFQSDVVDFPDFDKDVVMMFSTWPYIVQQYGRPKAEMVLAQVIKQAGVFFFETQLSSDGPGPQFLQGDDDVAEMLSVLGARKVTNIGSFQVWNRPVDRTVWRVDG